MRTPAIEIALPAFAGSGLAVAVGTVPTGIVVAIAIGIAFVLGVVFRGHPLRLGLLLIAPTSIASLLFSLESLPLLLMILVAGAGAGLIFGLLASAGVITGEVVCGARRGGAKPRPH